MHHLPRTSRGSAALAVPIPDGTWGSSPVVEERTRGMAVLLEDGASSGAKLFPLFPLTSSQINRRVGALCDEAVMGGDYGRWKAA